MITANVGRQLV